MLLSQWIEAQGGPEKVSATLGVKRNCVYAWKAGRAIPRVQHMKTIVTKSKGKVSYEEMINPYLAMVSKQAKGKKTPKAKAVKKPKAKTAKKKISKPGGF